METSVCMTRRNRKLRRSSMISIYRRSLLGRETREGSKEEKGKEC